MPREWIAIAVVKRPVGLEGFCAVEPFGDTFATLVPPCTVRIGSDPETATEVGIDKILSLPKEYRCRFSTAIDRTAAELLRGKVLYVERGALAARKSNEYFHFELVGMEVCDDGDGSRIGRVTAVHNYPSVDTVEVEREKGPGILLPLNGAAIAGIDRDGGRITARHSFLEEILD
jgi:16S rRNA processing protein RimM